MFLSKCELAKHFRYENSSCFIHYTAETLPVQNLALYGIQNKTITWNIDDFWDLILPLSDRKKPEDNGGTKMHDYSDINGSKLFQIQFLAQSHRPVNHIQSVRLIYQAVLLSLNEPYVSKWKSVCHFSIKLLHQRVAYSFVYILRETLFDIVQLAILTPDNAL